MAGSQFTQRVKDKNAHKASKERKGADDLRAFLNVSGGSSKAQRGRKLKVSLAKITMPEARDD